MSQTVTDLPSLQPSPLDILRQARRASRSLRLPFLSGTNLGSETLTIRMSIADFVSWSKVANLTNIKDDADLEGQFVAQREFYPAHARALAVYIMRGLIESVIKEWRKKGIAIPAEIVAMRDNLALGGVYAALQPLVVNIRESIEQIVKLIDDRNREIVLPSNMFLFIIDGQHREGAFEIVIDFLRYIEKTGKYPRKKGTIYSPPSTGPDGTVPPVEKELWLAILDVALNECTLTIEVHMGLNEAEERQLFSDLNSRGKVLSTSLTAKFNSADSIHRMTRDLVESHVITFPVDDSGDEKGWDDEGMTFSDVSLVNRILITGAGGNKPVPPTDVESRRGTVDLFWEAVQHIPSFGKKKQREASVAGQPVVLKALAKLIHDFAWGTQKQQDHNAVKKLFTAIKSDTLTFGHDEPFWSALFMTDEERNAQFPAVGNHPAMNEFVHLAKQSLGTRGADGFVRFSPAHNDIYPRLGDIIRWRLALKNRGAAEKAREKEAKEAAKAGAKETSSDDLKRLF